MNIRRIFAGDTPPPGWQLLRVTMTSPHSKRTFPMWTLEPPQDKKEPEIIYQPMKVMPKNPIFPHFYQPVGPLIANDERTLRAARMIRRRILQMVLQEANNNLKPKDKDNEEDKIYYAYLWSIAYCGSSTEHFAQQADG